jgi:DUF438 domain-containing protein
MKFRDFVLNESENYLSQKMADILTALQDLNESSSNMGVRHLISNSQTIVNQIRRIIHTHWPQSEDTKLRVLQKCGVAIMKTIEEKEDLVETLKLCQQTLESLVSEEKSPINRIATQE